MSDTNNGDFWKYEVDTVQRHGTTAATKARRHSEVSVPSASDNSEKGGDDEDQPAVDGMGIPTEI